MQRLFILISICVYTFSSCAPKESKNYLLTLRGSESMHETFLALKSDYEKLQDSVKIVLEGGGSRTGMMGVHEDQVDIGLSSFPFNLDSLLGTSHGMQQKVVAYDGIVLISNEKNPVQQLTNEQVTGIFAGQFTDWSELGGSGGAIQPIIRNENSGTQRFFTNYFGIEEVVDKAKIAEENSEIVASVARDENGIGFIGFAYFTESVHSVLLPSLIETDTPFVSPSFKNLNSGSYPLKRSLQIYYKDASDARISSFLKYLDTERAKLVIATHGLVPTSE